MTDAVSIYVPCADTAEAKLIARAVVEKRLAACANILPGVTSLYHWQGKVEEGAEVVLILKARAADFAAVANVICTHHSYDTPAITAWPIAAMDDATRDWLMGETKKGD